MENDQNAPFNGRKFLPVSGLPLTCVSHPSSMMVSFQSANHLFTVLVYSIINYHRQLNLFLPANVFTKSTSLQSFHHPFLSSFTLYQSTFMPFSLVEVAGQYNVSFRPPSRKIIKIHQFCFLVLKFCFLISLTNVYVLLDNRPFTIITPPPNSFFSAQLSS